MFEHRKQPLLSKRAFYRRLALHTSFAVALVAISLLMGILGYHFFAELSWLDSLLNAAMILTGMGPVNALNQVSAKLFASFYALFSGVAFITTVGVLFAPVIHRFLHKFHLEEK